MGWPSPTTWMPPSATPSEMMSWPRVCSMRAPRRRAPMRSLCGVISYGASKSAAMPRLVKRSSWGPSTTRTVGSIV